MNQLISERICNTLQKCAPALAEYGVTGMKWGSRRPSEASGLRRADRGLKGFNRASDKLHAAKTPGMKAKFSGLVKTFVDRHGQGNKILARFSAARSAKASRNYGREHGIARGERNSYARSVIKNRTEHLLQTAAVVNEAFANLKAKDHLAIAKGLEKKKAAASDSTTKYKFHRAAAKHRALARAKGGAVAAVAEKGMNPGFAAYLAKKKGAKPAAAAADPKAAAAPAAKGGKKKKGMNPGFAAYLAKKKGAKPAAESAVSEYGVQGMKWGTHNPLNRGLEKNIAQAKMAKASDKFYKKEYAKTGGKGFPDAGKYGRMPQSQRTTIGQSNKAQAAAKTAKSGGTPKSWRSATGKGLSSDNLRLMRAFGGHRRSAVR